MRIRSGNGPFGPRPMRDDPAVTPLAAVSHEDGATTDARMARCHEHGMDRDGRFDEVAAASNEASVFSAHDKVIHDEIRLRLARCRHDAGLRASGPTPSEQMTCRSDAGKFCSEQIGKPPEMNACLRENKAKLSEACRKVVESHGG
jgi:hypothetical protein